jgi:hypothetical protein
MSDPLRLVRDRLLGTLFFMARNAWFLAIAAAFLCVPSSSAICRTDPHSTYDVSTLKMANSTMPNSQANLVDYGIIFEDANDTQSSCGEWASIALYKKVRATLELPPYRDTVRFGSNYIGPYQGWLEGSNVSLVYATALRLGARGKLTKPLAQLIDQINYFLNIDRNCGFASNRNGATKPWTLGNSCMDDWAIAASGTAWRAAWKKERGNSSGSVQSVANEAKSQIASSFNLTDSVCAYKPNDPLPNPAPAAGPCTGSIGDLTAGTAVALGLHGGDAIPYGLGLMTSIASADVALREAGYPPTYTSDQQTVARALFINGDLHTFPSREFKENCYTFSLGMAGDLVRSDTFKCREGSFSSDPAFGYQPEMFPVYEFYSRRLGGAPVAVNYPFNYFDGNLFRDTPGEFFSTGRKAVYGTLGRDWVISRPPLNASLGDLTVKLKTYDGAHYVRARNGGGSDINAEATAGSSYETFSMVDTNGGQLVSGDEVYLQVYGGQYISANNGGGSDVFAIHFTPVTWERFTIEKTSGTGPIVSGNTVAFRTENGYYLSAVNGGGGQVVALYRAAITWEVFTLEIQ